jgi:type IV pilus assembly protein PilQ
MKSFQSAVNCVLSMAMIAVTVCGCASNSTVKTVSDEQPLAEESVIQGQPQVQAIVKSLTLVDQANSCSLSFLTGAAPQYTVFKLSDPHRIIVDLPEFSLSEQADLSITENDFITSVQSEKIQDKDRNYLRLTIALRDDFAYNTTSDTSALNISITRKKSTQDTPVQPSISKSPGPVTPAVTGRSIISSIVPHAGSDGMTVEIASQTPIGKFNAYTLQNPYRLVIDIPGAQSSLGRPRISVNNELIRDIRIGSNNPDNLRVVLDIASAELPQYQIAKQKNSLLVHLQPDAGQSTSAAKQQHDAVQTPASAPVQQAAMESAAPVDEDTVPAQQFFSGPNISFDFKDADIKNVLRLIADISGKNMIISESVAGRVTLKLDNIPLDEAMELILDTHGLGSIVTNNIIRIETLERLKIINEEKLLTKKSHEDVVDLEIKTFDVSYSKAKDMVSFIKTLKVLSDRGNITAFNLTNKVTVKDIPENIPKIAALIKEQDVPTRQVMIEARVVQSNPGYTKELGIRWGGTYTTTKDGDPIAIGGGAGDGNVVNLPAAAGLGSGGAINLGYIKDNLTLNMQLSALENDDKIKIVSNPRVIGLDNQEARIKQGVALPYLTLNDNGVTSTEFKDAVLELEVTPKITPSNTIALEVKVTKNQKSAQTGAGNEPGIDIREVETFLLIQSGVTAVIGGIYETQKTINIKRVPYFGTLPYLGYFFKNTKYEEQLTELLIFLTVTVLESPEDLAQGLEAVSG